MTMSTDENNKPESETTSDTSQAIKNANNNSVSDSARRAEHDCLAALSSYAINTNSLEVTRPTVTNCPDGGHDINVTGKTEEIKKLVSILTGKPSEDLKFLDKNIKNGKTKVRIDVKNLNTISGDIIDKHAADSNRSPDCSVNLLLLTNPDVKVTPEAKKRLNKQAELFKENKTLVDVALPDALEEVKSINEALAKNKSDDKK